MELGMLRDVNKCSTTVQVILADMNIGILCVLFVINVYHPKTFDEDFR